MFLFNPKNTKNQTETINILEFLFVLLVKKVVELFLLLYLVTVFTEVSTRWKSSFAVFLRSCISHDASMRSIHQRCSIKKCVVKILAKFTGKHQYHSLLFNKVAGTPLNDCFLSKHAHSDFFKN